MNKHQPFCPGLNAAALEIYQGNKARGFWPEDHQVGKQVRNVGEVLMLITSEAGEALEADRKGRQANLVNFYRAYALDTSPEGFKFAFAAYIKDTFADELADIQIRLLDYAGAMGIDLERHVQLKLEYNASRPYKHGKAY